MTTTAAPSGTWTGWIRLNGREQWRAVVTAASESAAWNKLLDYPVFCGHVNKTVTPTGSDPNERVSTKGGKRLWY